MATIKPEPIIKPDPDAVGASPAVMSDDDMYEDAGDLEFVNFDPHTNPAAADVYLTHVPKYLYDAWDSFDDDEMIQIGKIRKWTEMVDGKPRERMALLLDHTKPKHQTIPKEYRLESKDPSLALANTYLFTEQDLPGFKSESRGANNDLPPHLRRQHEQRQQQKLQQHDKSAQQPDHGGVKKDKYQPRYRKAIPKKTILSNRFRHEVNCTPEQTAETQYILRNMSTDSMKPKVSTSLVKTFDPSGVIQAGAHVENAKFSNMIRTAPEQKKGVKKEVVEKAARLGESELRDRMFACFEKHNYWRLTAFKQHLNQPEAWLRENLEHIAVLHKTGPFANHWELRPEYKRASVNPVEGAAPTLEGADSDGDEDMEDVLTG
ncbi:transcription initiation factor IIF, beta subunit-domain-containing protein [Xylariaceae sp. FL1272]|nr:transcription initiation factor IIF, beta subunit-domain-containing protein [Xylariaceae sp. FL1272]